MITLPIEQKDIQALHYQLTQGKATVVSCVGITDNVGTTSISYALARRFAASGCKTLLIDFDRMNHAISSQLACAQGNWTPENVTSMNIIKPMGRTNLFVLSAPESLSLHWSFKERHMIEGMFNALKKEYDMIIVDAGSVLSKREKSIPAEIISGASDVCVPIILSAKTNETNILKAQNVLQDQGCTIKGYVMNDYKNPPLSEELGRTLKRFEKIIPSFSRKYAEKMNDSTFLSQRF